MKPVCGWAKPVMSDSGLVHCTSCHGLLRFDLHINRWVHETQRLQAGGVVKKPKDPNKAVSDPEGRIYQCVTCSEWTGDPAGRAAGHGQALDFGSFRLIRGALRKGKAPRGSSRSAPPQEEVLPW